MFKFGIFEEGPDDVEGRGWCSSDDEEDSEIILLCLTRADGDQAVRA